MGLNYYSYYSIDTGANKNLIRLTTLHVVVVITHDTGYVRHISRIATFFKARRHYELKSQKHI